MTVEITMNGGPRPEPGETFTMRDVTYEIVEVIKHGPPPWYTLICEVVS